MALHLECYKIPYQREIALVPGRKWRVDFWIPAKDIAVEVEGGTWSNGRHSRGFGFENDARKYNALALIGVKVLRFTTQMVESGEAIDIIRQALDGGHS